MTEQDEQTHEQTHEGAAEGTPEGKRAVRQRAQEAETRATTAEARVTTLLGREAARLAAAAGLSQGADVLDPAVGGVGLADLLDDAGEVDVDLVRQAVEQVVAARPGLAQRRTSGHLYDGGARTPVRAERSWADVLGGRS